MPSRARPRHPKATLLALACAGAMAPPAWSAGDDDALALQSEPAPAAAQAPSNLRLSAELALGSGRLRGEDGRQSLRRASIDLVYSARLNRNWRVALSDRLDSVHPREGSDASINSLREAYVGWQDDAAQWVVEFGRINLRQGPGLGFNPTDFFRDGALRVSTTVNPFLVREYRMGSVMLRTQRLWGDGALSLALSPKLANAPSSHGLSADLGATNNRDRALLSLSTAWTDKTSSQLHLYTEEGGKPRIGASLTSLLGEATVAHAEASWGREPTVLDHTLSRPGEDRALRATLGATYTTASKLSLSAEFEYNGFALGESQWNALAASQPWALGAYVYQADRRQDLAARQALLLYAKQTDAIWRNLDLTGMVRTNLGDGSALAWLEVRYRFGSMDVAAQWLRYRGGRLTEYGLNPYANSLQLVGSVYF